MAQAQDVTDISRVDQLLRYAAAGQLEPLLGKGFTQERIALGAGLGATPRTAGPVLATALRDHFTPAQLHGLDEIIGALAPDLDGRGGLSSLALRLSGERAADGRKQRRDKIRDREDGLAAHVPPSWTRKMLADPPAGEIGVLMQASALLSEFMAAEKMAAPGVINIIHDRHSEEMMLLVRRLALISAGPPASRNYDAQTMLGMLASYAFEQMKDCLESKVRFSPLGFRIWRAIAKLVKLNEAGTNTEALRAWVERLISDSGQLRKDSLHAGSHYDLELALTIPAAWSPPGHDWVGDALRARAWDNDATIRERGTAVMGLWQRAISEDRPDLEGTTRDLHDLIAEFRNPDTRPDAAAGFRWLAATLEHAIENKEAVCNHWPDPGEAWFRHVQDAANTLDHAGIPVHLRTGTKNLFLHMILQNAGVYRRRAVETVVTSGMNQPVARALESLLDSETQEAWLRVRVQSALGFMMRNDVAAEMGLTRACQHAYQNIIRTADSQPPPRAHITEMHASLFAVGDCFGTEGAEERAKDVRESLRSVLTALASMKGARAKILGRPARAAAYLLTVTAQPGTGGRKDLSQELLQKLGTHPDPVARKLSNWVLSFRFAPDGAIRPLLAAIEHGTPDDTRH
jgi:hypothetical protein